MILPLTDSPSNIKVGGEGEGEGEGGGIISPNPNRSEEMHAFRSSPETATPPSDQEGIVLRYLQYRT